MIENNKRKIIFLVFLIILIAFLFLGYVSNQNYFIISLDKDNISCIYKLNFIFSQSFIDLLYFNNQAEIIYNILLVKKISTTLLSQDQKIIEKRIQYFLSYKNDKQIFTLFSSNDYYETNSISKITELINNIEFKNIFKLEKTGTYYCISNISITSLAPISPALFFLFLFYNPYNMKILNLVSNTIIYENSK